MFPVITSLANQRVKDAVKLRKTSQRHSSGRFLIDGYREIHRAIQSGIVLHEVFIAESFPAQKLGDIENRRIAIWPVAEPVFAKIRFGDRCDGIVAVAQTPEKPLSGITLPPCPLICVLEGIEKPGNVGAVFRSADGAGLDAVLLTDPAADLWNSSTIRASLGTVFHTPTAIADDPIPWLRQNGLAIAAAQCDGSIPYHEFDFRQPCAIVLGSEADGLSDRWHGKDVQSVRLPMHGIADSLNISVAAAVLFYHARFQRTAFRL
jgi:TrmH family RNA methyltransferase